jgi:hydroxymethylpyrimidine/phosphomethylpyrimidine kinase
MAAGADRPQVLCLSGHDPGGGAGIQADIEAIAALGGHALAVITAHTVQDSVDVARVVAADARLLQEQLDALFADFRPRALKVGLLGSAAQVAVVAQAARRAAVPVVLDPVLRAGGGAELAGAELIERLRAELLPLTDVLTPNAAEARRLAPAATLDDCGAALLALGARHVLITGGDEPGDPVVNHWFAPGRPPRRYAWSRVAGRFHGAGCTLAAATAALLARGVPATAAVSDAQAYTHRALQAAFAAGRGRLIPGRLP